MASTFLDRISGVETSIAIKAPVKVATTAPIALSGEQTIDGVAVVTGDRVLVKDQASAIDNGIWVVSTGAWSRADDFNGVRDASRGTFVLVTEGSKNAWARFSLATASPSIGVTPLSFMADGASSRVSARDFGVIGDGASDDTAAIAAAMAAARARGGLNGASVYLGAGRFKVSTLVIPDGVVLVGEGVRTTRIEKANAAAFSYIVESADFAADLAANDFAFANATSLETGLRNVGIYGLKTYTGTDVTGETISGSALDAAGHFQMVVNGGGTATSITGGVAGQPIKLVRGNADFTVNVGGTDAINVTLTTGSPYLFLTYTGSEWRLTSEIGKIAGGIRLYTRRPVLENVHVFNCLGRGVWLAGPDDGGSVDANEMPEGYIGPINTYRNSAENVVISGFHDAVIKSVTSGSGYFTGLLCERVDGQSNCTGEILHTHVYGGKYIGIDIRGPMHFGECITESNAHEGLHVEYTDTAATGPTWFGTVQAYLNCGDAEIGVNSYRQIAIDEPGVTIGKLQASAANTTQPTYVIDVTQNRANVLGIHMVGDANTYGIRNAGNYSHFQGILSSCARGLSIAGGADCQYSLTMQNCTTQVYNLGGDFKGSDFNISFFALAGATTWGGTATTKDQRAACFMNIKGKIDTVEVRSKFRGSADLSMSAGGEVKTNLTHGLWFTPDMQEVSLGLRWTGASFLFSGNGAQGFVGPYSDDLTSSYVSVAVYNPTAQASTITVSAQIG